MMTFADIVLGFAASKASKNRYCLTLQMTYQFAGAARIGDFVWYDTNHDGIQNPGEPGLGGSGFGFNRSPEMREPGLNAGRSKKCAHKKAGDCAPAFLA